MGLEYASAPKQSLLRIYIDASEGVGLSDCEFVSREVASLLDVEDPDCRAVHPGSFISGRGAGRCSRWNSSSDLPAKRSKLTAFAPVDGRRKFKGHPRWRRKTGRYAWNVDGEEHSTGF